jgi:hypothetical protein
MYVPGGVEETSRSAIRCNILIVNAPLLYANINDASSRPYGPNRIAVTTSLVFIVLTISPLHDG